MKSTLKPENVMDVPENLIQFIIRKKGKIEIGQTSKTT